MKSGYRITVFVICMSILISFSSGAQQSATPPKMKTVTDLKGNRVLVPIKVNRLAPNGAIAQMVMMLGCADRIYATGSYVKNNPMIQKIYPNIKNVAVPFGASPGKSEVNVEELLKVKPDLLIGTYPKLAAMGIPTLGISLKNFEDIKKTVTLIGSVLGEDAIKKAADFCAYYDESIKYAYKKTADLKKNEKPKVYYGSGASALRTEGVNAIASSWIEAAGGINVAAENGVMGTKKVSLESLIKWAPDIIVLNSPTGYKMVAESKAWQAIPAVRDKKVYLSPKGVYLWSVRSGEGALQIPWACKMIQPKRFASMDLKKEIRTFYARFYNYAISDSEIIAVLNPNVGFTQKPTS